MDKYKAVVDWKDLKDKGHIYSAGDPYPRAGIEVSEERIQELASKENKRQEVLIALVETPELEKLSVEELKKVNNDDIKARLEALGLEYKSNDNKDTLIERLLGKEGDQ